MPQFSELLWVYIAAIGLFAVIITIVDKKASKKRGKKKRIPELTLMLVALLGGALPMYVTMKTIRHKTKHKRFMIGLPIIIVLNVLAVLFYIF